MSFLKFTSFGSCHVPTSLQLKVPTLIFFFFVFQSFYKHLEEKFDFYKLQMLPTHNLQFFLKICYV